MTVTLCGVTAKGYDSQSQKVGTLSAYRAEGVGACRSSVIELYPFSTIWRGEAASGAYFFPDGEEACAGHDEVEPGKRAAQGQALWAQPRLHRGPQAIGS